MDAGEQPRQGKQGKQSMAWVRVWFIPIGDLDQETLVGSYRAEKALAERYAEAMNQHFAGLRITIDRIPEHPPERDLPAEQLWSIAP